MKAVEQFYSWREEKIKENPDWKLENRDWFLGMYLQTYPLRAFPLTSELFDFYEDCQQDKDQENEQRKLSESVDDSDQAVHPREDHGQVPEEPI